MRLSDINGPRGGVDKTCDIRLDAGLPHAVVIRERQASIYAAIAYAMDRAERALRRNLSMETSGHRRMEKRA